MRQLRGGRKRGVSVIGNYSANGAYREGAIVMGDTPSIPWHQKIIGEKNLQIDQLKTKLAAAENARYELLSEVMNIAFANRKNFEDGDEYRAWAQSRTRHLAYQYGAAKEGEVVSNTPKTDALREKDAACWGATSQVKLLKYAIKSHEELEAKLDRYERMSEGGDSIVDWLDERERNIELEAKLAAMEKVIVAGQAVVDRWDAPRWREIEHTGVFISALRKAIDAAKGK